MPPLFIGTSDGNKEISSVFLGAEDGNREILEILLGTEDGNRAVFQKNTWDGVAYAGTKTLNLTAHQQANYSDDARATPVNAKAAAGKWKSVTLSGYAQLRRSSSGYQTAAGNASLTATVRVYINGETSPRITKTVTDTWSKPSGSGSGSRDRVSLAGTFDLAGGSAVEVESVTVTMALTLTSGVGTAYIYIYADEVLSGVKFNK